MTQTQYRTALILLVLLLLGWLWLGGDEPVPEPQGASEHTRAFQQQVRATLPMADTGDFDRAQRGLIAQAEQLAIRNDAGELVWELGGYDFLAGADPDSVHPSLLRQARLNLHHGLYQVTEGIYQVRGYDLANLTFVRSDSGWIVFDALTVPETARAAYALVTEHLGHRPIKAVVISHTHADHFGGIEGLISQAQLDSGEVELIVPAGFIGHAVAENVLAGNVMARRASFQYGNILAKGPRGQVDAAIGKGLPRGRVGILPPTREITQPIETLTIDGVTLVMQNTPGTEAPAEMNTFLPQFDTFWAAENTIGALHNLYTLRGAPVRDALGWSQYINQALHRFGKRAEVLMASHSWPRWGNAEIVEFLEKQRDLYGYLHDEALRLANHGVTINEIQDEFTVPPVLAQAWYNRGYHGSYHRNAKAVLNRYLGYSDMNPATLLALSPGDSAPRYVAAMGGLASVLALGRTAFEAGEYRWCAELVNKAVFAHPDSSEARHLQADCLEQLGYQSESAGERNSFLVAAQELRQGMQPTEAMTAPSERIAAVLPVPDFLNLLGVHLNGPEVAEAGFEFTMNLVLPDVDERYLVALNNAHLSHIEGYQDPEADLTLTLDRADLSRLLQDPTTLAGLAWDGAIEYQGDLTVLARLALYLDRFDPWFEIIAPNDHSEVSQGRAATGTSPINR
ncbi:alkyl/aryl-sulfatase [Ferrimonas balearica]|uniref:alkyl/aryl-sulfatase n=1 Tax=Ferrimonas balearica TaxID=44012 RepID=UPI001C99612A|nr:alkyl sulfatase dimerization domain-containing protein [Ferrimonas balearica]MBY5991027.1 MBL fold metallo-hydrolase [Ferrimonas balearica]